MPKEKRKIGMIDGRFFPCPKKHIYVSTQVPKDDEKHYIKPIKYKGTKKDAMDRIFKAVSSILMIQIK